MPPDSALEATVGSLWGALETPWVTFWVILDTSGRQRGHFLREAPEVRKYEEFLRNPWLKTTSACSDCARIGPKST